MSNLEDVFLNINREFAPDLFGDLRSFSDSKNSSSENSGDNLKIVKNKDSDFKPRPIGDSLGTENSKDNENREAGARAMLLKDGDSS
jgi:hypothetical protein